VGNNASVVAGSIVAPCTTIPDGRIHLGPVSSSHEVCEYPSPALQQACADGPGSIHEHVVVGPVSYLLESFSHISALSVLYSMMNRKYTGAFGTVGDLMPNVLPKPFSLLCSKWQAKTIHTVTRNSQLVG
jgi:hypothetical protein